jgi:hypothetical protein
LSLALLFAVIFFAVGIYVLIHVRRHVKNVADSAQKAIDHFRGNSHGILGRVFAVPFIAFLAQRLIRRFL